MVRYCTSGLLYFTSQQQVKYSSQVKCNVSPYYTPPHAMINLLCTNTKRDGYNIGNPGAAIVHCHADVSTLVIGNTTLAELESTPKDSDLLHGRYPGASAGIY